jgi:hypothetical protein
MWDDAGGVLFQIATAPVGLESLGVKAGAGVVGRLTVKAISLPRWSKVTVNLVHILERHMAGGPFTAGRTIFPNMSAKGIERAIRAAYESSAKVGVQGERVLLRGRGAGLTIEMWFNKVTNTIETAYPVF